MERREFVSRIMKFGTCACTAMLTGMASPAIAAECGSTPENNESSRQIGEWIEHLMTVLDQEIRQETKTRIMEACGRGCARRTFKRQAIQFKGDLKGFLAALKTGWARTAEIDKAGKVIRIAGKSSRCACPLVGGKSRLESGTLCLCSSGWMKEIFETVAGGPVTVVQKETVLTGGKHCAFRINLG